MIVGSVLEADKIAEEELESMIGLLAEADPVVVDPHPGGGVVGSVHGVVVSEGLTGLDPDVLPLGPVIGEELPEPEYRGTVEVAEEAEDSELLPITGELLKVMEPVRIE